MPTLSRWLIKLGMLYLIVGLLMGVVMLAQPLMGWSPNLQLLRPVYLHFLFIGWATQLIMGVGYWMFPKYSKEKPRGSVAMGWFVLVCLNVGLVLRAISEPLAILNPQSVWGGLLAIAATLLLIAGWGFIGNIWGRIKER